MPSASEFAVLYSQLAEQEKLDATDLRKAMHFDYSPAMRLRASYRHKKMARALFDLANNDLRSRHEAREAPAA